MHHVSKIDESAARTPKLYEPHSTGFRRATYVDRAMGSVHMGVGICYLDHGGEIQPHFHSFEESFYILEGHVTLQVGDKSHTLQPGNYGLIPTGVHHEWRHVWAGPSDRPAKWLEMQAPQPRPFEYGRDTFFGQASTPHAGDTHGGHFDESQLPQPGEPAADGRIQPDHRCRHQDVRGSVLRRDPPIAVSDPVHAGREDRSARPYFRGVVSDRQRASTRHCGRQDLRFRSRAMSSGPVWDASTALRTWADEPVRWIETQAPLPPAKEVFRFERDWAKF